MKGSILDTTGRDVRAELDDGGVMDDAVDGSGSGEGVFEDLIPLTEGEIGSDDDYSGLE